MAKFNSKWQIAEDHLSDIARLTYPHTVASTDGETVATIATVEEAEALLDWYKDHYEHGMITQKLIKRSTARRKLRGAAERRQYLAAKAQHQEKRLAAFETAEQQRVLDKEAKRAARLAMREDAALTAYLPQKELELRDAIKRVTALARELEARPFEMSRDYVEHIGRVAATLAADLGTLRNHQYGVATSRLFAIHCAKAPAKTKRGKVVQNTGAP